VAEQTCEYCGGTFGPFFDETSCQRCAMVVTLIDDFVTSRAGRERALKALGKSSKDVDNATHALLSATLHFIADRLHGGLRAAEHAQKPQSAEAILACHARGVSELAEFVAMRAGACALLTDEPRAELLRAIDALTVSKPAAEEASGG